jgi:hypothetical protein
MTYTVPAGRYGDYSTAFIQAYIDAKIAGVLDSAPETLDTLNELAAALGDDPAFLTTMASANTTLQTNIDNLSTAAASARTTLQTLLQNAVDAVQADVDTNETTSASAVAAEATARGTAITNLQTTLQGLIDAVQADVDANELASDNAEAALSGRLDTLEADPTTATALAAVQSDVDANETASDAAETALSGRLDVLEADPTTKTYVDTQVAGLIDSAPGVLNTLDELAAALGDDENFATTITNSIAAVQLDVDNNETASDAAEAALSTRLDTLEADPTTQTALNNEIARATSVEGGLATDKLNVANPAATGQLTVDTNARVQFDSNLTKVENVLRGTGINIGNNIELLPAAAGGRVEITGDLVLDASDLTDAADDTAAAAAGVIVGQIYHNSGAVRIRLS